MPGDRKQRLNSAVFTQVLGTPALASQPSLSRFFKRLFFSHAFFVTNLSESFSSQAIVASYKKRGTMENFIKEAKDGFGFDQMKSHDFFVNEARMMLSLLAYNLTNWLRTLSFPISAKGIQIQTIRTRLIKVASKLVKSGRSLHFKLSSSFVYTSFFWDVLTRVQQLKLN